ncbi:DNA-binding transcriptional LysR family regulator [Bradyrhizobium sp. USDA 10063]
MEFNQIQYFLNLAGTLNFTDAAMRSGVSPAHAHPRDIRYDRGP